jgi:hypothetical protein
MDRKLSVCGGKLIAIANRGSFLFAERIAAD